MSLRNSATPDDALASSGEDVGAAIGAVRRVFLDHVGEEESSLFAYARANLGGELDAIARALAAEASPPVHR